MRFLIVIPGNHPIPRTCALEGDTLDKLVKSLSHFSQTHTLAWVACNYPLFIITLVEK